MAKKINIRRDHSYHGLKQIQSELHQHYLDTTPSEKGDSGIIIFGGIVRDMLLGGPINDIDIMVPTTPWAQMVLREHITDPQFTLSEQTRKYTTTLGLLHIGKDNHQISGYPVDVCEVTSIERLSDWDVNLMWFTSSFSSLSVLEQASSYMTTHLANASKVTTEQQATKLLQRGMSLTQKYGLALNPADVTHLFKVQEKYAPMVETYEHIRGFRVFTADKHGPAKYSFRGTSSKGSWLSLINKQAECEQGKLLEHLREGHDTPNRVIHPCGLYTFKDPAELLIQQYQKQGTLLAVCDLYGIVHEEERGFRSEFVDVTHVYDWSPTPDPQLTAYFEKEQISYFHVGTLNEAIRDIYTRGI